jgi:hypothetical protein
MENQNLSPTDNESFRLLQEMEVYFFPLVNNMRQNILDANILSNYLSTVEHFKDFISNLEIHQDSLFIRRVFDLFYRRTGSIVEEGERLEHEQLYLNNQNFEQLMNRHSQLTEETEERYNLYRRRVREQQRHLREQQAGKRRRLTYKKKRTNKKRRSHKKRKTHRD